MDPKKSFIIKKLSWKAHGSIINGESQDPEKGPKGPLIKNLIRKSSLNLPSLFIVKKHSQKSNHPINLLLANKRAGKNLTKNTFL